MSKEDVIFEAVVVCKVMAMALVEAVDAVTYVVFTAVIA